LIIYAPRNENDLRNILYTASLGLNHPIAIRYPRGRGLDVNWKKPFDLIEIGAAKILEKGSKIAVLSTGFIGNNVTSALAKIKNSKLFSHYDFGFVKPLDTNLLKQLFDEYDQIITIEDGTIVGGFGSAILEFAAAEKYLIPITTLGIPDNFVEHGTIQQLQEICKIDVKSLELFFSEF
jgi:1-deoxy-D-xylulose-5-phosphate synthase